MVEHVWRQKQKKHHAVPKNAEFEENCRSKFGKIYHAMIGNKLWS